MRAAAWYALSYLKRKESFAWLGIKCLMRLKHGRWAAFRVLLGVWLLQRLRDRVVEVEHVDTEAQRLSSFI